MKTSPDQKRREAWEDTVCGFLRRRYGVQPGPNQLDDDLVRLYDAGRSPWDASTDIGRRYDLAELESWIKRGAS